MNLHVFLYFFRLHQSSGGAERMICTLANALIARGMEVHLVSLDASNETDCFYSLSPQIRWHRLGNGTTFQDKIQRTLRLASLLKREKASAFIGFVMSGDKTIYAAAKLARTPIIAAERNGPSIYWLRYSFLQRAISFTLLHLAHRIMVQLPGYARRYPKSLHKKILAIPNPVSRADTLAQPNQPGPNGKYTLLTVSRLDSTQKRLDILINAFARIADLHPEWQLRIVGDGPEQKKLDLLIRELGVTESVTLEPAVSDIFSVYQESHLFVLPSLWEGFPNALAEAMAHGLPAVGFSDAEGVSDLISHGAGWLAPGSDDVVSLADTLSHAMSDHLARAKNGTIAAERMLNFDSTKIIDQWVSMLDKLSQDQRK
ncbi:glycosyltransferase [Thalassospira mesophila]|uniref:glycosyltransferase n=1 Tax=Thalassospira mesophila TaxID=1293891 RepID=UPI000A1F1A77|nr:glycosyltransferase [Thalassospira mesophila]